MIDGSLLLHAFARGKKGNERVRVLELGAIGRRHYSHRLRLPHGPIGLFSSLPSSFLPIPPFLSPYLRYRFYSPLLSTLSPSLAPSLSFFPVYFPFPFPVTFFSSTLSFLLARFVFSVLFYTSFFPSSSDFQARDLTAVSYLLRARILFGAPFNYLVRNSNEEEQLLY